VVDLPDGTFPMLISKKTTGKGGQREGGERMPEGEDRGHYAPGFPRLTASLMAWSGLTAPAMVWVGGGGLTGRDSRWWWCGEWW
jgi:hypothetical protein